MKLTPEQMAELGLDENSSPEIVEEAIKTRLFKNNSKPESGDSALLERVDKLNATVEGLVQTVQTIVSNSDRLKAEQLVDGAIQNGKILPADRDVWVNNALIDFKKTFETLEARKKNSALPQKFEVKSDTEKPKVNAHAACAEFLTAKIEQNIANRN